MPFICPNCGEEMMSLNHKCNPLRNALKDYIVPTQLLSSKKEVNN